MDKLRAGAVGVGSVRFLSTCDTLRQPDPLVAHIAKAVMCANPAVCVCATGEVACPASDAQHRARGVTHHGVGEIPQTDVRLRTPADDQRVCLQPARRPG